MLQPHLSLIQYSMFCKFVLATYLLICFSRSKHILLDFSHIIQGLYWINFKRVESHIQKANSYRGNDLLNVANNDATIFQNKPEPTGTI